MIAGFDYSNLNKETGWIGVDFDGTLNFRLPHSPKNDWGTGEPVPLMLETVKQWLAQGITV